VSRQATGPHPRYHRHCRVRTSHRHGIFRARQPHQRHIVHRCSHSASGTVRALSIRLSPHRISLQYSAARHRWQHNATLGRTSLVADDDAEMQSWCDFRHIPDFGLTLWVADNVFVSSGGIAAEG
jgi:hypothetical protein